MKNITKAAITAIALSMSTLGAVAPSYAQSVSFSFNSSSDRARADRAFRQYCESHRRDPDCVRFLGGHFHDRDYRNFYRSHRTQLDPIAGVFGFALGSIFAAAAANAANSSRNTSDAHIARCEAKFRSYNAETDQYLGYDGHYHYCTL